MFNIGPLELIVILLVALVVVGPSKLPELGRQIGKGLREFRKAQDEIRDTFRFDLDEPEPSTRKEAREAEPASADGDGDGRTDGDAATSREPDAVPTEAEGGMKLEDIPERRPEPADGAEPTGSEDPAPGDRQG